MRKNVIIVILTAYSILATVFAFHHAQLTRHEMGHVEELELKLDSAIEMSRVMSIQAQENAAMAAEQARIAQEMVEAAQGKLEELKNE